jgi:hypothetical protein
MIKLVVRQLSPAENKYSEVVVYQISWFSPKANK